MKAFINSDILSSSNNTGSAMFTTEHFLENYELVRSDWVQR